MLLLSSGVQEGVRRGSRDIFEGERERGTHERGGALLNALADAVAVVEHVGVLLLRRRLHRLDALNQSQVLSVRVQCVHERVVAAGAVLQRRRLEEEEG
eukprot:1016199-Prorocentrum_minimum.AAC.1